MYINMYMHVYTQVNTGVHLGYGGVNINSLQIFPLKFFYVHCVQVKTETDNVFWVDYLQLLCGQIACTGITCTGS